MTEEQTITKALNILESSLQKPGHHFSRPGDTISFLNNQHGLISLSEMFRGTIDGAAVYPREVVKAALRFNAAAVILAHNHPSGNAYPSTADRTITSRLLQALELIDVRVLDHIVVGGDEAYSFAEHGLI